MSWKCEKIYEKPLNPACCEEEYLLHQAALEWSLADCIVIQSVEDIQSKANWHDRLEPFHHQVQNLFTFCRRLPVTLLADDVGLGKTISAGLILSELMTAQAGHSRPCPLPQNPLPAVGRGTGREVRDRGCDRPGMAARRGT